MDMSRIDTGEAFFIEWGRIADVPKDSPHIVASHLERPKVQPTNQMLGLKTPFKKKVSPTEPRGSFSFKHF